MKKLSLKHVYPIAICLLVTATFAAEFRQGFRNFSAVKLTNSERNDKERLTEEKITESAFAFELNTHTSGFVKKYLKENGRSLEKIKTRSSSYFKIIEEVFTKYNIPLELKYLAVVESRLNTKAISNAGARGTWQLMPSTAKILGLAVNDDYDERTHTYKSTVAAAKYLKSLHNELGDWLLVIAAYNSGPGFVNKAIKKAGTRDFWGLQQFLPKETRIHVKKFISIHYYFEGENSENLLAQSAWTKYQKELIAFNEGKTIMPKQPLLIE
ncbi:MAG TPA: lytic transglycosylase domain-containing protein [Chitinophagaceae bacterium]|nr:lytic transglycosylase domain-containing protein [Chitinophagaceae bacterium]